MTTALIILVLFLLWIWRQGFFLSRSRVDQILGILTVGLTLIFVDALAAYVQLHQHLTISSEVWAAALAWGAAGIVVTLCATSWAVLLLVLIEPFVPNWSRLRPWRERFHSFPRLSFKAWLALCWASLAAISLLILLYSFDMISYIAPVALVVVWAGLLCVASWAVLVSLLLVFLLSASRQP